MGFRSKARECAFQMLYQWDTTREPMNRVIGRFWKLRATTERTSQMADDLARGAQLDVAELDAAIEKHLVNWRFDRIAGVERNILRLGAFELLKRPDTPGAAVIDEMIEIAKRFGEVGSSSFVNGVLDAIFREARPEAASPRPSRKPTGIGPASGSGK